jgi:hypothetical protein
VLTRLGHLIGAARSLHTLEVQFALPGRVSSSDRNRWGGIFDLAAPGPGSEHPQWTKLVTLHLVALRISSNDLAGFLGPRCPRLRELRLHHIELRERGSWKEVFQGLRESLWLQSCKLGNLYQEKMAQGIAGFSNGQRVWYRHFPCSHRGGRVCSAEAVESFIIHNMEWSSKVQLYETADGKV